MSKSPSKRNGSTPQYAIIIPHRNDEARLEKCLIALIEETTTPELLDKCEVLVVDNGSDRDVALTTARFAHVRVVSETQPGAALARNAGVANSSAPALFFLDCDCIPAPDWLAQAVRIVEGNEIVGGHIDTFDETPPPRRGAQAFETVFAFQQEKYVRQKGFSATANLLTWRVVFDEVGGFRPGLSEDFDWCQRAGKLGYKLIYDAHLKVAHPTRNDWNALCKKWRRLVQESFALHCANDGSRLSWLVRSALIIVSPLVDAWKIMRSAKLTSWGDRIRAIITLVRIRVLRAWWMLQQSAGLKI